MPNTANTTNRNPAVHFQQLCLFTLLSIQNLNGQESLRPDNTTENGERQVDQNEQQDVLAKD
jgi:hypothetical protein